MGPITVSCRTPLSSNMQKFSSNKALLELGASKQTSLKFLDNGSGLSERAASAHISPKPLSEKITEIKVEKSEQILSLESDFHLYRKLDYNERQLVLNLSVVCSFNKQI